MTSKPKNKKKQKTSLRIKLTLGSSKPLKFERVKLFFLVIKYMKCWSSYIGERPFTNKERIKAMKDKYLTIIGIYKYKNSNTPPQAGLKMYSTASLSINLSNCFFRTPLVRTSEIFSNVGR